VKVQVTGSITLPAASAAPLTVAVYVVFAANAAVGVNVAVCVPGVYAVVPATAVPAAFFNPKVTEEAVTGSLNTTEGATPVETPVAPTAGVRLVTVGLVVSGPAGPVVNTTSTQ